MSRMEAVLICPILYSDLQSVKEGRGKVHIQTKSTVRWSWQSQFLPMEFLLHGEHFVGLELMRKNFLQKHGADMLLASSTERERVRKGRHRGEKECDIADKVELLSQEESIFLKRCKSCGGFGWGSSICDLKYLALIRNGVNFPEGK